MGHPQSSPRGLLQKEKYLLDKLQLGHNDTTEIQWYSTTETFKFSQCTSAIPVGVDAGIAFGPVSNSNGVAIAINTTGTTWKYLNVTSAFPT